MTQVWMLTSGSYSDYGVVGIFSSEANARKHMESFPKVYDGYNEPYEVGVDEHIDALAQGLRSYEVVMAKNGDVDRITLSDRPPFDQAANWFKNWDDKTSSYFSMWARSPDHAVKIANDRRIAALAGT